MCVNPQEINEITEGNFPLKVVEYLAMGKPVVASDVASLPEVVSGEHVLVAPRSPEAIVMGVQRVCRGEMGSSESKSFTWDECVDRYLEVYRDVVSKRSIGHGNGDCLGKR